MTPSDLATWPTIAAAAWEVADDRKLTKVEKIAVTIKAISEKAPFRVSDLCVPLSQREVCAVLRTHLPLINTILGTNYRYVGASYANSNSGPFGRYSSARGSYHEPCLLQY